MIWRVILYRSVRNLCLNYLRDDKRRMAKFSDYVVEETEDFRFSLEEMEEREEIQKAINLLPEQCRLIFTLCCLENMKYQEVADKLGISINTVRTQMTRAFKSLRDTLSGKTFTSILFVMMSIQLICWLFTCRCTFSFKKSRIFVTLKLHFGVM